MIPLLLLAGFILATSPGVVPSRTRVPASFARNALSLQPIGFALLEAGLLLWATPALLELVGAADLALLCRRMLGGAVLGGWEVGAAAGFAALVLAGLALRGGWRVRRTQQQMRVEPWLGVHQHRRDHELIRLPTDELVAFAVGGRSPQVVIGEGVFKTVGTGGAEAVRAHELVHVRHRHDRFLVGLGAVSAAFGWLPPVKRGGANVRVALERWADEEAAETVSGGREGMRTVLVAVTTAAVGGGVTAFGSADTIIARVRALSEPPPRSSPGWEVAGQVTVWLTGVAATGSLAWAGGMSIVAVSNPGLCVI